MIAYNKLKLRRLLLLVILLTTVTYSGYCQQTVFGLFKNDISLGDKYYREKNFQGALQLYQGAARKDRSAHEIKLRIARSYFSLKEYHQAIAYYDNYIKEKRNLPWSDVYFYGEAQAATGNYNTAIEYYRKCLTKDSDDELIIKKIWRLSNVQYLHEDSMHYAVRPVSLNTEFGELCAVLYRNGIVFMSNRKEPQIVENVNASLNAPFYRIYFSRILPDTSNNGGFHYGKVSSFNKEFAFRFNAGPVVFYDKGQKMVFVSTANETGTGGKRTLQLHFAELKNWAWNVSAAFPYNSGHHSISDPAISEDGKTLYFSSDMGGGLGGRDLYKCIFDDGKWTQPVNLGEPINTSQDEVFPFLHQNRTIYFSSNGHPGIGGLDIFQAAIKADGFSEPQNAGYPINSSYDDFGIVVDSLDTHGYFSSNRKKGGYNDDIYEFDMDLQAYPVTISGVIKYKELTWSDSSRLKVMPGAKIYLVDNLRNVTVQETGSDQHGNFSIVVPYFSKYIIRVVSEDNNENVAVLEIPKHKKQLSTHEIVIVKDIFKSGEIENGNSKIEKLKIGKLK